MVFRGMAPGQCRGPRRRAACTGALASQGGGGMKDEDLVVRKITIGITTRNRWQDLRQTLGFLASMNLSAVPTVIIDDGSDCDCGREIVGALANCHFVRSDVSLGLVEQRNRIAELARTDYLVSLDDDSCITDPQPLAEAVRYMDSHPDVAALAFRVVHKMHPGACADDPSGEQSSDTPGFFGNGHLLRLKAFRQLGGYRPYFRFMAEERELCLRLYGAGLRVVTFPAVQVNHWAAASGRSTERGCYFMARNTVLTWLLNLPWLICVYRLLATAVGLVWLGATGKVPGTSGIRGYIAGLREFSARRTQRAPITMGAYRRWLKAR